MTRNIVIPTNKIEKVAPANAIAWSYFNYKKTNLFITNLPTWVFQFVYHLLVQHKE